MPEDKKTRNLTPAQLRSRRRRNQKRFGKVDSLSDVERQCPADINPKLLEFAVDQTRYLLRSGMKGVYGAHVAKEAERLFSELPSRHRQFFIDFVNWLVRNKVELTSGRYSSRNTQKTIAAVLSAATGYQSIANAISSVSMPRTRTCASARPDDDLHNQVSVSPNAEVDTPPEPSAGALRDRPPTTEPLSAESSHRTDDRVSLVGRNAKRDDPPEAPNAGSQQTGREKARMPRPFTFRYKRKGENLANAFFGSILYTPELENITAKAQALVDDVDAVRAVQGRGQTERDYLEAAMADLGIKLP